MNKKVMIGVGVILVASVGFVIYRKRKIAKNIAEAESKGFVVEGCKNGKMIGRHPQTRMLVEMPCGIFKF